MLTGNDDLMGHQTPKPFALAGDGDPRFTERCWYTAHPIGAPDVIFDAGLGYYPNRGIMDGFAGVTIGRRQHNFRASRRLGANPLETSIGPFRIEVLVGAKRHRLTLDENASGVSFSLEFEGSFPGGLEKQNFRERNGQIEEDLARMAQFGRWRGWIKAAVAGGLGVVVAGVVFAFVQFYATKRLGGCVSNSESIKLLKFSAT